MSSHFAAIAYTASVRAAQRQYNGGELPAGAAGEVELGPREREFIAARDSFYLATVGETGWPHVQHRGGPRGFLAVLGPSLLGFADYQGNRQYVSVGNLASEARAALILMDYPRRRRLKILGRVEVIAAAAAAADSGLLARMSPPYSGVPVERILLVRVAAFDWNCSQHITSRFTEDEWLHRYPQPETTTTKE